MLISIWEMSLGWNIELISKTHKSLKRRHGTSPLSACAEFFLKPLTAGEAFSLQAWHLVWATYALYDPSYANCESFGFFIDVGNGYTTLLPTLLFAYGSVCGVPSSLGLVAWACVCLCSYYQMLYGTVIYFLSYLYNKRYRGFGKAEVAGFVGVSNVLWAVFPVLGMCVCVRALERGHLEGLRGA
jgi:hypothetical protein